MSDESKSLNEEHEKAVRRLPNDLHRLNNSVIAAVEAGVNVELMRASRHHDAKGAWGDMLIPIIRPGGE